MLQVTGSVDACCKIFRKNYGKADAKRGGLLVRVSRGVGRRSSFWCGTVLTPIAGLQKLPGCFVIPHTDIKMCLIKFNKKEEVSHYGT